MTIDHPAASQTGGLRRLWQQAFGDSDEFLDLFFGTAFSPDRCLCVSEDGQVLAALYWLDCRCRGEKLAYIYAVATEKASRGRGLCRSLMECTHRLLQRREYAGAILVPGEESLFQMYGAMGYRTCSNICECLVPAGTPIPLRAAGREEYAGLRRKMLSPGAVLQEGVSLAFLEKQGQFYAGEDILLLAVTGGETLFVPEFLGDPGKMPGVTAALGAKEGTFRTPGDGRPFAMYYPLTAAQPPEYFGFAFD